MRNGRAGASRQRGARDESAPRVELLERRTMLSADLTAAFAGAVPAALPPVGTSKVAVRVANAGDAPASGSATVTLYASAGPTLAGAVPLASAARNVRLRPGQSSVMPIRFATP